MMQTNSAAARVTAYRQLWGDPGNVVRQAERVDEAVTGINPTQKRKGNRVIVPQGNLGIPPLWLALSVFALSLVAGCGGHTDEQSATASGGWGIVRIESGERRSGIFVGFMSQPQLAQPMTLGTCLSGGSFGQFVGDGTSAGRISVMAGTRRADVSRQDGSAAYAYEAFDGPLDPNVPIEVHADGDTVPAFDASLLPGQPLDVTYRFDGSDPSDAALEVSWDAVPQNPNLGRLSLNFDGEGMHMLCSVDATAGRFVVPREQFREMAAHAYVAAGSSPFVHLTATPTQSVTVHAGAYEVTVLHTVTTETDVAIAQSSL